MAGQRQNMDQLVQYRPMWGGGCAATPITKDEMCAFVKRHGWPTDMDIVDASGSSTSTTPPPKFIDLRSLIGVNLWGIGRAARNIAKTADNEKQFRFIEKGFFNLFDSKGKVAVEVGDMMFVISGPSLATPGSTHHVCVLVTGVCWSPTVFEVTMLEFGPEVDANLDNLPVPCKVVIASRLSRVSPDFRSIDCRTSDELAALLMQTMGEMHLYTADYDCIIEDGTLKWSKIKGLQKVGCLWQLGQRVPLLEKPTARRASCASAASSARLLATLASGDPFDPATTAKGAPSRPPTQPTGARRAGGRGPFVHTPCNRNTLWKPGSDKLCI